MKKLLMVACGIEGEYSLNSKTESIVEGAFYCSPLSVVRLNEVIKEIGRNAFKDSSLQELHIRHKHPEQLKIGDYAFDNLKNCILYVPVGTGYAYRHHPAFAGKFKEAIIEK